jgi:hypothetical protein
MCKTKDRERHSEREGVQEKRKGKQKVHSIPHLYKSTATQKENN